MTPDAAAVAEGYTDTQPGSAQAESGDAQGERQGGRRRNRRGGRGGRDRDESRAGEANGAVSAPSEDAIAAIDAGGLVPAEASLNGETSAHEAVQRPEGGEGRRRGRGRDRNRREQSGDEGNGTDAATSDASAERSDAPAQSAFEGSTARSDFREPRQAAFDEPTRPRSNVQPESRYERHESRDERPASRDERPESRDEKPASRDEQLAHLHSEEPQRAHTEALDSAAEIAPTPVEAPVETALPRGALADALPMAAAPQPVAVAAAPAVARAAEPFVLPLAPLEALAESAGLEWVNSDAEKIRAVREAMAGEAPAAHVPRERKPTRVADEGPLVLVETRKDLSQVKLPFEHAAQETQGGA